ncbi:RPII140-upstream gene protein [Ooceraea biroi]|nr:RPII140-upstream gene protein [Ooceraea biroi]XP_011343534.1 RPII140-upstream gene protein [Ooceraea biroi]EZA51339.1 hypothetical protein X777_10024 [Ooceraea biroi]
MFRLTRFAIRPILCSFPIIGGKGDNPYDRPKNVINTTEKPLNDELGWDRVKKIFRRDEYGTLTKELQSIVSVTLSGSVCGMIIGGLRTTQRTVDNFIASNEATRFDNHLHAKNSLHQKVLENFISKGGGLGIKLGFFCFMFSFITTCTTAYRGKLSIENYILGASVTGLLFRVNMGIRGALVGATLGGTLGAVCGIVSMLILSLSGVSIDEVLEAQRQWIVSRKQIGEENMKRGMAQEKPEIQQMMEETQKLRILQKMQNVEDSKT